MKSLKLWAGWMNDYTIADFSGPVRRVLNPCKRYK